MRVCLGRLALKKKNRMLQQNELNPQEIWLINIIRNNINNGDVSIHIRDHRPYRIIQTDIYYNFIAPPVRDLP
jgi:hypothetical protein